MHKNHSHYDDATGILFGCLGSGTDLLNGLMAECQKHGIYTGEITCIGSLERATYVHGIEGSDGKPGYSPKVIVEGPMELLSGTGFLCKDEQGQLDLHFHGLVIDKQGMIRGGHFVRGENPTLVTIEFTVRAAKTIQAVRRMDPDAGFRVITFGKNRIE